MSIVKLSLKAERRNELKAKLTTNSDFITVTKQLSF